MQRPLISRYWIFQLAGWGLFAAINIFLAIFIMNRFNIRGLERLLFFVEIGILFSHIMREVIRSTDLLMKTIKQQLIIFVILAVLFSLMAAGTNTPFEYFYDLRRDRAYSYKELFYLNFFSYATVIIIWNFIYFMYHFIAKTRKQELDTIKLEALVKSLELKTIKAHINPHFIFNALNGIRALIDENPVRARKAVTELSNILRSSLNAEKGETVSLEDELKIVKDYLALENMRFEDRLKIEYEIDDDTLDQQVPPMMLQTLVENAIKHGISKNVRGGMVRIISDFSGSFHELAVQNTGYLNGGLSHQGFGLSSTQDRLSLLYGEKAKFEIKQINPDLVEAKVLIPSPFSSVKTDGFRP
jgi:two-component system, LytTR family, sensor kinase